MPLTPSVRIPEERVAGILARAAELDRDRRETLSVDAIRAAALDAGISPSAVDAALAEYAARNDVAPDPEPSAEEAEPRLGRIRGLVRRVASALKRPSKLAVVLFVLGLTAAAGEVALIMGWAAWLFLAGRTIRKQRPSRRAAPFVLALVGMTIGLGLGFAAAEIDDEVIGTLFALAVPLLVLGSGIIKLRLPRRFRSSAGELRRA